LLPQGRKNTDEDCNKIVDEINDVVRMQVKEILAIGMYKQAETTHLQLLKSMVTRFVLLIQGNPCSSKIMKE